MVLPTSAYQYHTSEMHQKSFENGNTRHSGLKNNPSLGLGNELLIDCPGSFDPKPAATPIQAAQNTNNMNHEWNPSYNYKNYLDTKYPNIPRLTDSLSFPDQLYEDCADRGPFSLVRQSDFNGENKAQNKSRLLKSPQNSG